MRWGAVLALAGALGAGLGGEARAAELLFEANFEDGSTSAWQTGGAGLAAVTVYAGNHSLRLQQRAQAISAVDTGGFASVSIRAAYAAYRLGGHDLCVAEYSLDEGKSWKGVTTLRPGYDDGVSLHAGGVSNVALKGAPRLLVRLRAQLSDPNATCWADNVSVTGERG